ncbi:MAG TPA: ATP-grasp domain-containing protein [Solirubrobacteraceae bacterium]|nr:ATP-grasp domain-containing protein [Solirubrobacteraceae bacterium]
MNLYEHEAKAILTMGGISVPRGDLWPNVSGLAYPVAVKAQLLEGGRGKRGGVLFAESAEEVERLAQGLSAGSEALAPAAAVLVEEKLNHERELYVAFAVDRGSRSGISLLALAAGGVDIDESAGEVQRLPVPALTQRLPGYLIREAAAALDIAADTALEALLNACFQLFVYHDCLLLEINPLAMLAEGRLVALDAHVELDDSARFRHPEWPQRTEGTEFEVACRELGAVATEIDPDGHIAIVTSGAGLGMATLDLVHHSDGRARCVVDLGGMVFRPEEAVGRLIELVAGLEPRAILVNCFLQLASLEALAAEMLVGLVASEFNAPVVIRADGQDGDRVRAGLEHGNVSVFTDFDAACRAAVAASTAVTLREAG